MPAPWSLTYCRGLVDSTAWRIVRSLSQQHETFLKGGEEVRRADRCRKPELTGRDPGDRERESCDQPHTRFCCSRDLKGSGLACSKTADAYIPITLAAFRGVLTIAMGGTRATRHSTRGYGSQHGE